MKISVITPTHDPRWLKEAMESLQMQGHQDWEWIVSVNAVDEIAFDNVLLEVRKILKGEYRAKIVKDHRTTGGVGARKKFAFDQGEGEILLELDHDDLLAPAALSKVAAAFTEGVGTGFVYSDYADFEFPASTNLPQGQPATYGDVKGDRPGWEANGIQFYEAEIDGVRPGRYLAASSFPPSAVSFSLINWCPNHLRAWRRLVYRDLGGHNPELEFCDDQELLARTYLATRCKHLSEPLYLYRVANNTFNKGDNQKKIAAISAQLHHDYLERLVLRECELLNLPAYDLGGALGCPPGWVSVDLEGATVTADLRERWPWQDGSVGAFRAADFLEHVADKRHVMGEIWRCLRPGGWLLSQTPSTDGRGAFQDPTHVSFWNQNSFWYWTRPNVMKYIKNADVRFQEINLFTSYPSKWHEENLISYVTANLIALKGDYEGPGRK